MKRYAAVLALVITVLFSMGRPASARRESGSWVGGSEYTLSPGDSSGDRDLEILFIGGYTAGHFENADLGGDYRFVYGMADHLHVDAGSGTYLGDGHFYLLEAAGGVRFLFDEGLGLRLTAGANLWWGSEDFPDNSYTFFQAKAGAGLVRTFYVRRVALEAAADIYLVFDYVRDDYDFTEPFLLQGLRTDGSLNAVLYTGGDLTIRAGARVSFTTGWGLLSVSPQSMLDSRLEGWLGLSWGF